MKEDQETFGREKKFGGGVVLCGEGNRSRSENNVHDEDGFDGKLGSSRGSTTWKEGSSALYCRVAP